MIWLNAVACRVELRKMGDPTAEAQHCHNIFKGFASQQQAQQIYRELIRICLTSFGPSAYLVRAAA